MLNCTLFDNQFLLIDVYTNYYHLGNPRSHWPLRSFDTSKSANFDMKLSETALIFLGPVFLLSLIVKLQVLGINGKVMN